MTSGLVERKEQVEAALRNAHGLPFAVIASDTHPNLQGIWCDNGMAGVGQVAVVTSEFHPGQAKAMCALANAATGIPSLVDHITALTAQLAEGHAREAALKEALDAIANVEFPGMAAEVVAVFRRDTARAALNRSAPDA